MLPILLTAFAGTENTSAMVLQAIERDCRKLLLPANDADAEEMLKETIRAEQPVCVIMLGQKPVICDKIAVEPSAMMNDTVLHTPMDCTMIRNLLTQAGCKAYLSKGCGNSACNHAYFVCLREKVNCIFLHIPTKENLPRPEAVVSALEALIDGLSGIPCML